GPDPIHDRPLQGEFPGRVETRRTMVRDNRNTHQHENNGYRENAGVLRVHLTLPLLRTINRAHVREVSRVCQLGFSSAKIGFRAEILLGYHCHRSFHTKNTISSPSKRGTKL